MTVISSAVSSLYKLPLLSARPAVTFPATERRRLLASTKSYRLITEAHVYEQLAQRCYMKGRESKLWPFLHDFGALIGTSPSYSVRREKEEARQTSAVLPKTANPSPQRVDPHSSDCSSMTYDGTMMRSSTSRSRGVGKRDGTSRDRNPSSATRHRVISFRDRVTHRRRPEVNMASGQFAV